MRLLPNSLPSEGITSFHGKATSRQSNSFTDTILSVLCLFRLQTAEVKIATVWHLPLAILNVRFQKFGFCRRAGAAIAGTRLIPEAAIYRMPLTCLPQPPMMSGVRLPAPHAILRLIAEEKRTDRPDK